MTCIRPGDVFPAGAGVVFCEKRRAQGFVTCIRLGDISRLPQALFVGQKRRSLDFVIS